MKTSKYFTSSGYIFVEGLTYICFADIGTARFSNLAKFAVTEKKLLDVGGVRPYAVIGPWHQWAFVAIRFSTSTVTAIWNCLV